MSALWFVALIVLGAALILALFFAIPAAIVSRLRYRLWAARDQLYDQIHAGCYSDIEQPSRLLRQIEITIEVFDELTFLNVIWIAMLARRERPPQVFAHFNLDAMNESDRERIKPVFWVLGGTMLRRIFFASWSGLIAFAIATPAFLVVAGFRRLFPGRDRDGGSVVEDVKDEFRKTVDAPDFPVEALARPNGDKRKVALSTHV